MGFATAIQNMTTGAIANAAALVSDFWPLLAFLVGLGALGYIVSVFKS